jgi:hypothetical protein
MTTNKELASMYSLLVLGHVPGTDIQITFGLWLSGLIVLLFVLYNRQLLPRVITELPKRGVLFVADSIYHVFSWAGLQIWLLMRQVLLCIFAAVYFLFFMPHHDPSDRMTS